MAVDWPTTLPRPSQSGYSVDPGDGRAITPMTQGRVRVRKRFENVPDVITANFEISFAELRVYLQFWNYTTEKGVKSVNMPLESDGAIVPVDVIILSQLRESIGGNRWRINMELMTQ